MRDALKLKDEEVKIRICKILGRIPQYAGLSREADFQKAIESSLQLLLGCLDEGDSGVRQEAIRQLGSIPIRRSEIVSALLDYLRRSDRSEEDRLTAIVALAAQASFADSDGSLRQALKPAIPELAKALASPEAETRGLAVRALGHIGGDAKPALDAVRTLAHREPEASVRTDAANATKAIEGTAKMPAPRRGGPGGGCPEGWTDALGRDAASWGETSMSRVGRGGGSYVIALAVWLGLAAGLLEVGARVLCRAIHPTGGFT